MTLKEWLRKSITGPHKTAATFLLAVWFVFAVRSFLAIQTKQHTFVHQTADLLSIAVTQHNRELAESLLESLITQGGASSAGVCDGTKQQMAVNQKDGQCNSSSEPIMRVVDYPIPGSSHLTLKASFNLLSDFYSILSGLGFALIMVFCGFYFIQLAQSRIKKDLLDPLLNNLLGNENLEIQELVDLRKTIEGAKELEAQRAVMLAIQENNQQVAHDIRSPVESIKELLKQVEIKNLKVKLALDKTIARANLVANALLSGEKLIQTTQSNLIYDVAQVAGDIVIEKRALFDEGEIETDIPKFLICKSTLTNEMLSRILSNIVDNAILACDSTKKIKLSLSNRDGLIRIQICDSGRGISKENLVKIGQKGFTFRKESHAKGSGRGVYSAVETLSKVGGSIRYESEEGRGTVVTIEFPTTAPKAIGKMDYILVDNEEIIRMMWEACSQDAGIKGCIFSSAEEFLYHAEVVDKAIPIFIDSDLGNGHRGEELALDLKMRGFKKIILVTAFRKLHGANLPGLDAVIGKSFDNALEYLNCPNAPINSIGAG